MTQDLPFSTFLFTTPGTKVVRKITNNKCHITNINIIKISNYRKLFTYLHFTFIYFWFYKRRLHHHNIFNISLNNNKNIPIVTPLHFFTHVFIYSSSLIIYLPRTLTATVV